MLLKPKFWDSDKVSFFAILLFPISVCIKLLFFFKKKITKKKCICGTCDMYWKYLSWRNRKNSTQY